MDALLLFLSRSGRSFMGVPAPGDVTVGGVLAVAGHGTGLPTHGQPRVPGASFGSLSNSVVQLTAIVWDETASAYRQRTFQRTDRLERQPTRQLLITPSIKHHRQHLLIGPEYWQRNLSEHPSGAIDTHQTSRRNQANSLDESVMHLMRSALCNRRSGGMSQKETGAVSARPDGTQGGRRTVSRGPYAAKRHGELGLKSPRPWSSQMIHLMQYADY